MFRRRRRETGPTPEVSLPITPMLDMTFQLLFFFIASYREPSMEGQIEMTVPERQATAVEEEKPSAVQKPGNEKPKDPDPEVPYKVTVMLTTNAKGDEITQISLSGIPRVSKDQVKADQDREKIKPEAEQNKDLLKLEIDPKKDLVYVPVPSLNLLGELLNRIHSPKGSGIHERLVLEPSGQLKFGRVMELMDVCRSSGFPNVTFGVPLDKK